MTDRYELVVAPSVRRQLAEQLPEAVAAAAFEFIVGPLLDNPLRVGKRLRPPLDDRYSARRGTYRVIYRVDIQTRRVTVVGVFARSGAYRDSALTAVWLFADTTSIHAGSPAQARGTVDLLALSN